MGVLALALLLAQPAPSAAPADPRIQLLPYDPDRIVSLPVGPGFAAVVELAPEERAENIVVGNSAAWQVTANRTGDRVVVKPLAGAMPTNMIILTGSRRYLFMLEPGSGYDGQSLFVMRFSYPEAQQAAATIAPPQSSYRFRGDKALFPRTMYNDGNRTVISWDKQAALPAVFALDRKSKEQLVNGRMVGDDFVIEGSAARYKFRFGNAEALAILDKKARRR